MGIQYQKFIFRQTLERGKFNSDIKQLETGFSLVKALQEKNEEF